MYVPILQHARTFVLMPPMRSPAGNYDELQAEIGRRFPALSRQLQAIARFALERPQDVALDTVAPRPPRSPCSPRRWCASRRRSATTATPTCSASSASGWWSAAEAIASASTRMRRDHRSAESAAQGGAARLRRRFDRQPLAPRGARRRRAASPRAVKLLARAKRIHVLAQRRAFPVACYLSYALAQLELPVTLLDGVGGMVREQARASHATTCSWR